MLWHSLPKNLLILQSYLGTAEVRGITVDHWRSCQEWKEMNANYSLDYYFTSKYSAEK